MSAMDMHAVAEQGLAVLWRVTWQGALWALTVWALTRALPRLPSSARAALWWLVGLKCLVGLCAPGLVRLPLLPAPESPPAAGVKVDTAPAHPDTALEAMRMDGEAPLVEPSPERTGTHGVVLGVLLAWLGGLAWQGWALLRSLAQLRRIRREARPLEDATLHQAAAALGRELGLARIPRLRVSEHAPSPLALGLLRPEIILPRAALEKLSPQEQRMALAHELAHVRRGDLWLGWVPALAQALFFFHPLVRRACREYALAREEACDAAALQATGAEPHEYGRLLLVFGVARAPAAAAMPGASSHLAALKRRIAMLEHAATDSMQRPRWIRWALGGLALVALVPIQVVAREPEASTPVLALAQAPSTTLKDTYVLLHSNDSATMSGSMEDLRTAKALAGADGKPLAYVRRGGREYVIRDPQTLAAIGAAFEPQRELGEKQAKLGEQMEALGEKQAEVGEKQAALGAKQAALGAKQGELGGKMGEIGLKIAELALARARQARTDGKESPEHERQEEQLEREQEALDRQMEEYSRQMEALGDEMEKLSEPMKQFTRPMEELGRQMEELGRQMEAHSREADKKVQALLDDAVRKGLAEPVKR
ncbi:M56 family metallopeptidase [Archangium lipolyticum]|uniref:M56 family metallopeptidase n=1 Tax=Archangium lipolyticum TaxID=2970465 RepID=UPI002149F73D|nr:M56 family metallopeptidase [Archangium lipolyticum]